ncbi:MAG: hypothetical protein WC134_01330 [Acholeplasmataceae bacterium]|jgi:hypothetical protein|nr:hypothetical protein [Acholeplasmataceae bacterium]MDD4193882.1 hypothetical protein [Acholeplasmataceae bacterium]MDY0338418.1 hypothetical protein [Acholeplasmataceae bacterium]
MRFDVWTIEKKQKLEADYKLLFGGQVRVLKRLYRSKMDPVLCDELIENVAIHLFRVIQEQRLVEAEALLERMFLSELNYDVFLYEENELEQYSADLLFFNNHESVQFYDIRIKTVYDVKQLIKMILHIGIQYYNYLSVDDEIETHLNEYPLLSGFEFEMGQAPLETTIRIQKVN